MKDLSPALFSRCQIRATEIPIIYQSLTFFCYCIRHPTVYVVLDANFCFGLIHAALMWTFHLAVFMTSHDCFMFYWTHSIIDSSCPHDCYSLLKRHKIPVSSKYFSISLLLRNIPVRNEKPGNKRECHISSPDELSQQYYRKIIVTNNTSKSDDISVEIYTFILPLLLSFSSSQKRKFLSSLTSFLTCNRRFSPNLCPSSIL